MVDVLDTQQKVDDSRRNLERSLNLAETDFRKAQSALVDEQKAWQQKIQEKDSKIKEETDKKDAWLAWIAQAYGIHVLPEDRVVTRTKGYDERIAKLKDEKGDIVAQAEAACTPLLEVLNEKGKIQQAAKKILDGQKEYEAEFKAMRDAAKTEAKP